MEPSTSSAQLIQCVLHVDVKPRTLQDMGKPYNVLLGMEQLCTRKRQDLSVAVTFPGLMIVDPATLEDTDTFKKDLADLSDLPKNIVFWAR